jgi:hypothetical protein
MMTVRAAAELLGAADDDARSFGRPENSEEA